MSAKSVITVARLKRLLDPADRIEPGASIFDAMVGGFIDPCVATIKFGGSVLVMHVNQSGGFRVGSAQAPMSCKVLAVMARAYRFVEKAKLFDLTEAG